MSQDKWLYERSEDGSARFVLGTIGENPLVCFGVNPSTAVPGTPDPTVRRVMGFAQRGGHDSWIMLNLYPQISTDPNGLHDAADPALKAANEEHIARMLDRRPSAVLGAWGGVIKKRDYLPELLRDIVALTTAAESTWFSIGEALPTGHPRHPSRAPYNPLQPFDVAGYLQLVG